VIQRQLSEKERRKASKKKYQLSAKGKASHCRCNSRYLATDEGKATQKKNHETYSATVNGYLRKRYDGILSRCNNSLADNYPRYGGCGVRCLFKDFSEFFQHVTVDLGLDSVEKLQGLQIHCIDSGDYRVGNIVFLTALEHAQKHKRKRL